MKINDRLKKIGDLVEANSFCLDVGCDHALLDIYLIKRNQNIKVIASDIKEGPLKQALKNIQKEHLENEIELRLGAGLNTYRDEVDTVIISGMGGRNIIGICKENSDILKKIKTLIISPNNYQENVKRFLCKKGFYIEKEELIEEKNFIYQIIVLKPGKKHYTKKEYFFGPILLQKKGVLFQKYYQREKKSMEILIEILPKKYWLQRHQNKAKIKMIEKELED